MSSTIAVIQARYSSTRLPGKALADLCGRPVIAHVIERAEQIKGVDRVILALPNDSDEAPLIEWAMKDATCEVFLSPGETNDVLGRFVRVVGWAPEADTVMRLTGDCPLLEPGVCAHLLDRYRGIQGCEYAWLDTQSREWPDGLDAEVFSTQLLGLAHRHALTNHDREHVTTWMRRMVRPESLPSVSVYAGWPKVSIDTQEDLDRVRGLMAVVKA